MKGSALPERLYLISSCCFVAGSLWAFWRVPSAIDLLYVLGSSFFFLAAATQLWRTRPPGPSEKDDGRP